MLRALPILLATCLATPPLACETALVLAVDVSGSIDPHEYLLQTEGLADALEDPEIVAALLAGEVALSLVHWSGSGRQRLSVPWQQMLSSADVTGFADAIRSNSRPREYSNTAIGDAILFSIKQFETVPECQRFVIDVSGDGKENSSLNLPEARALAEGLDITINAIAIEADERSAFLSGYFLKSVITPDGFVVTAIGLADYPRAIRAKLLRELTKPVS